MSLEPQSPREERCNRQKICIPMLLQGDAKQRQKHLNDGQETNQQHGKDQHQKLSFDHTHIQMYRQMKTYHIKGKKDTASQALVSTFMFPGQHHGPSCSCHHVFLRGWTAFLWTGSLNKSLPLNLLLSQKGKSSWYKVKGRVLGEQTGQGSGDEQMHKC